MLKYRLFSGFTIGGIILSSLLIEGTLTACLFTVFCLLVMSGGLKEFFTMTEKIGLKGFSKMTTLIGCLGVGFISIPPLLNFELEVPFFELLTIIFIIFGFLRVFNEDEHKVGLSKLFVSIAGLIYIGWTLSFIAEIYFFKGTEMLGRYLVLYLVAVTKFSDIGAFFTGTISSKILPGGNHKIAPKLSPGKSWEGFFGGICASVAVALFLRSILGDKLHLDGQEFITVNIAITTGAVFATLGFIGDVAESALKRASGMKDSGTFIPGMGGVLDVVDSLTLVSPLFYCLLTMALK
ncbi:MAG: phosphatidate cytidylyltransferase [Lentisphaeraceae bacterium]|nr:phosphatidate cytidylyltransferase [Lentisphaeraceae bacterium]